MASFINKRQQARHERALQDLIKNVPGNERCADCQAHNPGWASWSLGIFLCMRCAALHRKLGTHISKVKSLSMDTWSSDQVDSMKRTGNTESNRFYNPRNVRPTVPSDPDMVDSAMEKFIREKYQRRTLGKEPPRATSDRTGSAASDDRPPPVPEKSPPRIAKALRLASSNSTPLKSERQLPSSQGAASARKGEAYSGTQNKLAMLKEMGFADEQKNAAILKAVNGNMDKAVDALTRLGEGGEAARTSARSQSQSSQNVDPRGIANTATPPKTNGSLPQAQPLIQTDYNQPGANAPQKSYNPFEVSSPPPPTQALPPLETSFQNLNVAPGPLFPNHTGTWPQQNQHNPFLKTFTPPISPSPYQYTTDTLQAPFAPNPYQQTGEADPSARTNPFLRPSRSQNFATSNPFNLPQAASPLASSMYNQEPVPPIPIAPFFGQNQRSFSLPQSNPYQQYPGANPTASQFQFQSQSQSGSPFTQSPFQQSPYQTPRVQSPVSMEQQSAAEYTVQSQQPQSQNFPHMTQHEYMQPYVPQQPAVSQQASFPGIVPQTFPQQQQQQAPIPPQPATRLDKSSILALYGQPHLAPAKPEPTSSDSQQQQSTSPPPGAQARSFSLPLSGSSPQAQPQTHNPFTNLPMPAVRKTSAFQTLGHIREESRDFVVSHSGGRGATAANGRHSPDAFAGLSARYQ